MADENQIRTLLASAEQALDQGRRSEALTFVARARALAPTNPDVLAAAGILTHRAGDAGQARLLIDEAVNLDPGNPRYLVNRAIVLRELKDQKGELEALNAALALDPYFFTANLQKGSLLELQGKRKQATTAYHAALSSLPRGVALPPALRPVLERAQQFVQAHFQELESLLSTRMAPMRSRYAGVAQDRVDDCLAVFLGRKRIYNSQPTMTHFPRVPAVPFFERRDFPWLEKIEAATDDIRQELLQLLQAQRQDFVPYVSHAPGVPLNQFRALNNSLRWSALFLYQDGKPQSKHIDLCPRTMAALGHAPLHEIPDRAPTVWFSRLEPKTRIPPHTGATNTRLIVHIPLIVPPGCGFRVGSEVREWQPGTALVFDDTIEHEAWNDSDEQRVVMIFDIWNPFLTPAERDLMTAATSTIAEFFDSP